MWLVQPHAAIGLLIHRIRTALRQIHSDRGFCSRIEEAIGSTLQLLGLAHKPTLAQSPVR
jgi:hypothetical protein